MEKIGELQIVNEVNTLDKCIVIKSKQKLDVWFCSEYSAFYILEICTHARLKPWPSLRMLAQKKLKSVVSF